MTTDEQAEAPREDPIIAALAGETVTHASALATVTKNCVVVRDSLRGAQVIIAISDITSLRKLAFDTMFLLVIACGLFTIAAASYASKQGAEVALPIGAVGVLFAVSYLGTRRAAVLFGSGAESVESIKGSHRQADAVIRAVQRARTAALLSREDQSKIVSRL